MIGENIKSARKRLGLSQAKLAELTGVSQPTVANWERGSHIPRERVANKISQALGIAIEPDTALARAGNGRAASSSVNHLSAQVFHIPLLDWPASAAHMGSMAVTRYVSLGLQAQRPIALILQDQQMSGAFVLGSIVIIERSYGQIAAGDFGLYDLGEKLVLRKQGENPNIIETQPAMGLPKISVLPETAQCLGKLILTVQQF